MAKMARARGETAKPRHDFLAMGRFVLLPWVRLAVAAILLCHAHNGAGDTAEATFAPSALTATPILRHMGKNVAGVLALDEIDEIGYTRPRRGARGVGKESVEPWGPDGEPKGMYEPVKSSERKSHRSKRMKLRPDIEARVSMEGSESSESIDKFGQDDIWFDHFVRLLFFKLKNGHCGVKTMGKFCPDPYLGRWVRWQRERHKKGVLISSRRKLLDALGFPWVLRGPAFSAERGWDHRFVELVAFRKKFKHCNVPEYGVNGDVVSFVLGRWVTQQRVMYKLGRLHMERIQRLQQLGFVWDAQEADWLQNLMELALWRLHQGNSRVPSTSRGKNQKLSQWVSQQRMAARKGRLLEARRTQLDNLAFVWEPGEDSWNRRYAELAVFALKNGHCNVPQTNHNRQPTINRLGQWMNKQRELHFVGRLHPSRRMALDEIKFTFELRPRREIRDLQGNALRQLEQCMAAHYFEKRQQGNSKVVINWERIVSLVRGHETRNISLNEIREHWRRMLVRKNGENPFEAAMDFSERQIRPGCPRNGGTKGPGSRFTRRTYLTRGGVVDKGFGDSLRLSRVLEKM